MADYDWFDRGPTESDLAAARWRPQGLLPIWESGISYRIKYYLCGRGCGTIVHDPETHIKNVCTEWEPVAGD